MKFIQFAIAIAVLSCSGSGMAGTNNLPTETTQTILRDHINKFKIALSGDLVPRNTSGTVGDETGSLGTTVYYWLRAFITSGYWSVGDIKPHHSYNGAADPGEGWMLCDGRQITEAAYNTEHGSAHWATYVVTSPLLNKYLPNLTGRYLVGAATTSQSGSVAITAVGNGSNQVDISHSHTVNSHNHQWYSYTSISSVNQTYDSGGAGKNLTLASPTGAGILMGSANSVQVGGIDFSSYTSNATPGTSTSGSATQSIQPDSIQVQYYMRVME